MEIVDLDRDVTEPGADIDPPILRAVHQLKRDYLLAWELEHAQTRVGPQINPADLLIPERGVEVERGGQRTVRVRWTQAAPVAVLEWTSPVARLFFAPAVRVRSQSGPILRLLAEGDRRFC